VSTTTTELSLHLTDDPQALPQVRRALREWLHEVGVAGDVADDIVLASWEACANAVEHPLEPAEHEVVVDARVRSSQVCVDVRDAGRWRRREARPYRGLGLTIVNALMDEVSIRRGGRSGTVVHMCRALDRPA
jgi:anti-sigma regulatory factor (Ser/Thr protein kinase)